MSTFKRSIGAVAAWALLHFLPFHSASAAPFLELGDAGDLPGTAQSTFGSGSLDSISGALSVDGDIDMFLIFIEAGGGFSAETTAGDDPQLFLFDSTGRGILADDDSGAGPLQAALPLGHAALSTLSAGLYYIAVADFDYEPVSASGFIFFNTDLAIANGPGAADPVSGWSPAIPSTYSYVVNLTGASFMQQTEIPEPGSIALLGAGVAGAMLRRRPSSKIS